MSINSLLTNLPVLEAVKAYVGGGGGGGTVTEVFAAGGAGAGLTVSNPTTTPTIGLNCAAAGTAGQVLSQSATPGELEWIDSNIFVRTVNPFILENFGSSAQNPSAELTAIYSFQNISDTQAIATIGFASSIGGSQFLITTIESLQDYNYQSPLGVVFPPQIAGGAFITYATSTCININTGEAGYAKFYVDLISSRLNVTITMPIAPEAGTDIIVTLPTMFIVCQPD